MITIGKINGGDVEEAVLKIKSDEVTAISAQAIVGKRIEALALLNWSKDLALSAGNISGQEETVALILAATVPVFLAMEISHNRAKSRVISVALTVVVILLVVAVFGLILYFALSPTYR